MNQLLLQSKRESTINKEIKVVLDRNGYKRARVDEEDYDGRVVTITVPNEDYKYIRENIGIGDDHIKEIFANALTQSGIPNGYRVLAAFKDSFEEAND